MPRNGAGTYSLPSGSTITNGDTSDQTDINTPLADIVTDLNTARPIVAGGTGSTSATAARTALGLAIGTDVQAQNANLASLAGLTLAADKMLYPTGADTLSLIDFTAFARSLLDDADATTARATLGLIIGTDVQAQNANLADVAGLAVTDGGIIVGDGANFVLESGATARASLGLVIGTDVQAQDANLASLAGLTLAADRLVYSTAAETLALATLTAFGRSLIDDADAATARGTLEIDTDDAVTFRSVTVDGATSGYGILAPIDTSGAYIGFSTDGDSETTFGIDAPDVTSADANIILFGARTNTSGAVEFTMCDGTGSDTSKAHSFFEASALISRKGGNTGIGRDSAASYTMDVYDATDNIIARFQSGDARAAISLQDSASSDALQVGIAAVGDGMILVSNGSDRVTFDANDMTLNGTFLAMESIGIQMGGPTNKHVVTGRYTNAYDEFYFFPTVDGTTEFNKRMFFNFDAEYWGVEGPMWFRNGTVPTAAEADGCLLYAEDVSASSELKVRDEAENVTTLSPHNFSLIGGPSEPMAWGYYSERNGVAVNADILRVIRIVERLSRTVLGEDVELAVIRELAA